MIEAGTLHTVPNFESQGLYQSHEFHRPAKPPLAGIYKCQGTSSLVPKALQMIRALAPEKEKLTSSCSSSSPERSFSEQLSSAQASWPLALQQLLLERLSQEQPSSPPE